MYVRRTGNSVARLAIHRFAVHKTQFRVTTKCKWRSQGGGQSITKAIFKWVRDQVPRNGGLKIFSTNSACLYPQYINFVHTKETKKNTSPLETSKYPPKCVCSQSSVPDPAGGAHSALPDPLTGLGEGREGERWLCSVVVTIWSHAAR